MFTDTLAKRTALVVLSFVAIIAVIVFLFDQSDGRDFLIILIVVLGLGALSVGSGYQEPLSWEK